MANGQHTVEERGASAPLFIMWLLTTRNRPEMCQEVLDSCVENGISTPGVVWCDGCEYPDLKVPDNWEKIEWADHLNIGEIMRRFYASYPGCDWYGWMSDDCRPLSKSFDTELIEAAGSWCMSYPDDDWQHGIKPSTGKPHVTSMIVWGGDLVREVGWWVPDGMIQMYIDDVWEDIAMPLGINRYCGHVKTEHRHFANGRRKNDSTDTRQFNGASFPQIDKKLFDKFRGGELPSIVKRLKEVDGCVREMGR